MKSDNKIIFYKGLEKKFSIFRWLLLVIVAPITFKLSDFRGNTRGFMITILFALLYNLFVTIAAYSKNTYFHKILELTMYFDIPIISLILYYRGGLRSDIYFIYFLVISYDGAKFGFRGTITSLVQSLVYFSIITFYFTLPQYFSLSRYFIRIIYLITLTYVMYEVNHQIEESRIKEEIAREQACQDPLTKIPNRLFLSEHYEILKKSFEEKKETFAIVLFDIDNFKSVNDEYGHAFGDNVLIALANILKNNILPDDFVCRFGGEEFVAFFAKSSKLNVYSKADKIREEFASYDFEKKPITVSVGINIFQENYSMIENISFADEAMYVAKHAGKNKVILYENIFAA